MPERQGICEANGDSPNNDILRCAVSSAVSICHHYAWSEQPRGCHFVPSHRRAKFTLLSNTRLETNNIKAAFLVVIAMTMITTNDAIIKHLTQVFEIGQVMFLRGFMVCVLFALVMLIKKQPVIMASYPSSALLNTSAFCWRYHSATCSGVKHLHPPCYSALPLSCFRAYYYWQAKNAKRHVPSVPRQV